MPELPEVEVIRRGLERWVAGRAIASAEVLHPRSVRRNTGDLPAFGYTYLGDAQFYMDLIMRLGSEGVTVCDDVVYHQGQDRELWPHLPGLIAQAGAASSAG